MTHIILHHHIFKNAGSTLDFSLSRQFGNAFFELHAPGDDGRVTPEVLGRFLEENPAVKVITSHHFHGQNFSQSLEGRGYRFFNFAMVRRPLDRLVSTYKFYKRGEPTNPVAQAAHTMPLASFISLLIEKYPHLVDNAQVSLIANQGFYNRRISETDLNVACSRIENFALCAPVDRYDEAMVTAEYYNSPVYAPAGLDLSYIPQNVSERSGNEGSIRHQIGDKNYEWLDSLLSLDERLCAFASRELDRRIAGVPDFPDRLNDFRRRCKLLISGVG